jgi:hypothetical protein
MNEPNAIDGVFVQWGDRLFYPGNRIVKDRGPPRLTALGIHSRAAFLRQRIAATLVRRAPQVMVKVTGGGRGMGAITAHLRYISKNGRLAMENERGELERGRSAVRDVAEEWRYGGSLIPEVSHRREAHNILLSMPRGVDPEILLRAAREFAQTELADHKYVMVLHDHQANPHVHVSVRAESRHGRRLNPRKADLQRWRETFAEKLRGWGIEAEASRQAVRGESRNYPPLWRLKAREEGRERKPFAPQKGGVRAAASRSQAAEAWTKLAAVLSASADRGDRQLAVAIGRQIVRQQRQQLLLRDQLRPVQEESRGLGRQR